LLGSFDATEDIVQEAFVKAYQAMSSFKSEYAFYPWLSTIARNLAYNQISREEKSQSLDEMSSQGFDPESVDLGPMEKLLDNESQRRFTRAVAALPAKYRTVFVLRQFEQMDYAAIASYLKIPPGTVDSRLHRARKMLMESLKDLL
jgi:RNA polymerase sigma-70 factor (ECF subfamily)